MLEHIALDISYKRVAFNLGVMKLVKRCLAVTDSPGLTEETLLLVNAFATESEFCTAMVKSGLFETLVKVRNSYCYFLVLSDHVCYDRLCMTDQF